MKYQRVSSSLLAGTALCISISASPALGQGAFFSQGAEGDYGRSSSPTGQGMRGTPAQLAFRTATQGAALPSTAQRPVSPSFGASGRNGLPPTTLDSFVLNAGGNAELIYGDEGAEGLPPYEEFTQMHRINAGIFAVNDAGLTTGHGSLLPNAWGGDEFVKPEPFTQSGANLGAFQQGAAGFGAPQGDYGNPDDGSRNNGDPGDPFNPNNGGPGAPGVPGGFGFDFGNGNGNGIPGGMPGLPGMPNASNGVPGIPGMPGVPGMPGGNGNGGNFGFSFP